MSYEKALAFEKKRDRRFLSLNHILPLSQHEDIVKRVSGKLKEGKP